MRRALPLGLLLFGLATLVASAPAEAADRPKPGSVYRDGPSGRYLLGGTWHAAP